MQARQGKNAKEGTTERRRQGLVQGGRQGRQAGGRVGGGGKRWVGRMPSTMGGGGKKKTTCPKQKGGVFLKKLRTILNQKEART